MVVGWVVDLHFLMPALGYPQFAQVCFCTWRDRWPGASISIPVTSTMSPSQHTATSAQNVRLVVPFSETSRTLCCAKAVSILNSVAAL